METETFKDIPCYEGKYQIGNLGTVVALNYSQKKMKKKLIASLDRKGYYKVTLSKKNLKMTYRVHRLISEAFIEKVENKNFVNHINGIKTDNRIENLEWVTQSENTQKAYDIGIMKGMRGQKNILSKKVKQISLVGELINEFEGVREAERNTGISSKSISKVALGQRKSAGGYVWKYD